MKVRASILRQRKGIYKITKLLIWNMSISKSKYFRNDKETRICETHKPF